MTPRYKDAKIEISPEILKILEDSPFVTGKSLKFNVVIDFDLER